MKSKPFDPRRYRRIQITVTNHLKGEQLEVDPEIRTAC